jgi:hypothetical protein
MFAMISPYCLDYYTAGGLESDLDYRGSSDLLMASKGELIQRWLGHGQH